MRRLDRPGREAGPSETPVGASCSRGFPVGGTPKCGTNIFEVKQRFDAPPG